MTRKTKIFLYIMLALGAALMIAGVLLEQVAK
ncbi:hypothetical protein STSP2_00960 [Anaerohalosphaera lusitana]|uniref:Uncharacterized protein n=1 Tax=Anaerohalosphaera lusitana TaxID=1936003 RepID=A0A1U9NJQ6_9BACT|nr:hypothetical protein STSP2_00960 [Anaerohalosphaera lusitana]